MEKTLIAKRQEKSCSILHTNETEQIKKKKKKVYLSQRNRLKSGLKIQTDKTNQNLKNYF